MSKPEQEAKFIKILSFPISPRGERAIPMHHVLHYIFSSCHYGRNSSPGKIIKTKDSIPEFLEKKYISSFSIVMETLPHLLSEYNIPILESRELSVTNYRFKMFISNLFVNIRTKLMKWRHFYIGCPKIDGRTFRVWEAETNRFFEKNGIENLIIFLSAT